MKKIAINGFGRIGRSALKIALTKKNLQVVAINDLATKENSLYLLQNDTVYGKYKNKVELKNNCFIIGKNKIALFHEADPQKLPWKKLKVDVVLECTGRFTKKEEVEKHLLAGAQKVIISAPTKSEDILTVVKSINHQKAKTEKIIANASCTTNCVAPIMAVLQENFGVEKSLLTTVHAMTASQRTVDMVSGKDFREGRSASQNIIPSTTGAAVATSLVLPKLKYKFDGISMRVPVVCGSVSDIVVLLSKNVTVQEINKAFISASQSSKYRGIIDVSDGNLVSSDILGSSVSTIIDLPFTRVVGGNLVKVVAWYDNEWGYANRLVEMVDEV